jgi:hypothetical protein
MATGATKAPARRNSSVRATKLGVAKTPVAQQTHIADPTGGATVDSQARTAINAILDVLDAFGLTAAS